MDLFQHVELDAFTVARTQTFVDISRLAHNATHESRLILAAVAVADVVCANARSVTSGRPQS